MKVKYFGNSTFLLQAGESKLITNPFETKKDLIKATNPSIIVLSHKGEVKASEAFTISTPGEYEVKDMFVYGYSSSSDEADMIQADIFMFDLEGVHLGFIDTNVSSGKTSHMKELGISDILFISLAKDSAMSIAKRIELTRKIEPYIIIPMEYDDVTLKEFINAMGIKEVEKLEDVKFSTSDITEEDMPMRCVVLQEK